MHVHNVSIKTPGRSCVQIIQISIVKLARMLLSLHSMVDAGLLPSQPFGFSKV